MNLRASTALSLIVVLAACSPGHSQDGKTYEGEGFHETKSTLPVQVPSSIAAIKSSFSPVVKQVAPAVVNVYAKRITRQRVDPFWEMFGAGESGPQVQQSLGSGVIIRKDGVIITNNHVVEGGQEFMIVLNDRREYPAKLLLADPRTDLAVLKLESTTETFPALILDDGRNLEVGDLVLAIGNPFGVGQTVTNGIISALNRTEVGNGEGAYIQTDAPINPGNSGGALVDMDGQLIGINSFILSRSGSSAGIGFAVPAQMVKRVVDSALGGASTVQRPWLGAKGNTVTSDIAKSLGMTRPQGVLISDIYGNGPADKAGLKTGDVLISLNDQAVNDDAGLRYQTNLLQLNQIAIAKIIRNGKALDIKVKVAAPSHEPPRDERLIKGANPFAGARVINLSPAVAEEIGIDPFDAPKGVMIYELESRRSHAASVGLKPGDILRNVNGQNIETTRDIAQIAQRGANVWRITIVRNGQTITASLR